MRALLAAAVLAAATPAFADETTGKVLAFDRKANIIVLQDKTVWELGTEATIPEGLVAGETVRLVYESAGEDGLTKIYEIVRLAN